MSRRSPRSSPDGRGWLRTVGPLFGLLAIGLVPGPSSATETEASDPLVERAREITSQPAYQAELPGAGIDLERGLRLPMVGLGFVTLLLWALGVAVVLLLAIWLLVEVSRRRARRHGAASGERGLTRPKDEATDTVRASPLAGEGRFAEALHALLLQAIRRLCRRDVVPTDPALTSRELLRRVRLDGAARSAFAELVLQAERAHFGGTRVGREQYDGCLTHFRTATGEEPL